jgi:hypothetical protein
VVLAGPIEFSPAEIAAIIAVLTLMGLVLTAPGWALLGYVMGRRADATGARRGQRWVARLGGALLGLAVCAAVGWACLAVAGNGSNGIVLAAVVSWVACGGIGWLLWPRGAPASYDG